jgi:hypothetical protein
MAFLRFSRDKRGYEHFQLVQPATGRRGKSRPRILYWFRSPPNVKIGREPFDESIRTALEDQNPDVEFDWAQILATPVPPADAEHWRERQRRARQARQFADEEEPAEIADTDSQFTDSDDDAGGTRLSGPRTGEAAPRERPGLPTLDDEHLGRGCPRTRHRLSPSFERVIAAQ